jgi:cell division septation protein DedD
MKRQASRRRRRLDPGLVGVVVGLAVATALVVASSGSRDPRSRGAPDVATSAALPVESPPLVADVSEEPRRQAPAPAEPAEAEVSVEGDFAVQLVAMRSEARARAAWLQLSAQHAELLGPLTPFVSRVDLTQRGTYYRLRAGPLHDQEAARELCAALGRRRVECLVVRR